MTGELISVDEALRRVLENASPLAAVRVPVRESLWRTLVEDVKSDLDSPPWDKSMVDGYAIRSADLVAGSAELEMLEEVVAGAVPSHAVVPGTCIRIMTGAPIPEGADCVVMIERTSVIASGSSSAPLPSGEGGRGAHIAINDVPHKPGQNILPRGSSFHHGDLILPKGQPIHPVHVGLLCEVGCAQPLVIPRPSVAVLSTGNELVEADVVPAPGQIRNSNGPMLASLVTRASGTPIELGVACDEHDDLHRLIGEGLRADVLLLSGGVSAGVLDLVPSVLTELGVEQVFHKIRMKPGKPLWFGVKKDQQRRTLVFGLPGNPVSSLVGFHLFVDPALLAMGGLRMEEHPKSRMRISEGVFQQRGDRDTYYPVRFAPRQELDQPSIELLPWQGSADLRTLGEARGLAIFPAGEKKYAPGDLVDVIPI